MVKKGKEEKEAQMVRDIRKWKGEWSYNDMEEKWRNKSLAFLRHFWGPVAYDGLENGSPCSGDWQAHRNGKIHFHHREHQWRRSFSIDHLLDYSLSLCVSLILASFIMAMLIPNDFGILKTLGSCVVLLVSIPIVRQVAQTSTMALKISFFTKSKPLCLH